MRKMSSLVVGGLLFAVLGGLMPGNAQSSLPFIQTIGQSFTFSGTVTAGT